MEAFEQVRIARTPIRIAMGVVVVVIAVTAVAMLAGPATSDTKPTFGEIPEEAWLPDGTVILELVPDYVSALDRDGEIAGFVRATDILTEDAGDTSAGGAIPVVDSDLELVGHMVDDRGFVPIGSPFASVPKLEIQLYETRLDGSVSVTEVGGE